MLPSNISSSHETSLEERFLQVSFKHLLCWMIILAPRSSLLTSSDKSDFLSFIRFVGNIVPYGDIDVEINSFTASHFCFIVAANCDASWMPITFTNCIFLKNWVSLFFCFFGGMCDNYYPVSLAEAQVKLTDLTTKRQIRWWYNGVACNQQQTYKTYNKIVIKKLGFLFLA